MGGVPGAEIVLLACHVGATFNDGICLLEAVSKKFNATVYGNQSWSLSSNGMFNNGYWQRWGFGRKYQKSVGDDPTRSKQIYRHAYEDAGNWTKVAPNGTISVITNVYFDAFGKIKTN